MGRPLNKRWFGATGTGTGTGLYTGNNLPIRFKTGGSVYEGMIVSQKGARTFVCTTEGISPPATARCKLVQGTNSDPANNGEATLVGILNGVGTPVTLQKLTNKVAVSWAGVRYKWTLSDDSTETLLILTAM